LQEGQGTNLWTMISHVQIF